MCYKYSDSLTNRSPEMALLKYSTIFDLLHMHSTLFDQPRVYSWRAQLSAAMALALAIAALALAIALAPGRIAIFFVSSPNAWLPRSSGPGLVCLPRRQLFCLAAKDSLLRDVVPSLTQLESFFAFLSYWGHKAGGVPLGQPSYCTLPPPSYSQLFVPQSCYS